MDSLMSRRKLLKSKLTRIKTKLDTHLEVPMNLQKAKVFDEQIQELWVEHNSLFDEILSTCAVEEDEVHEAQYAELAERFDDIKVQIRFILEELTRASPTVTTRRQSRGSSTPTNVQAELNMKLPKLNIPTFDGNMLLWTTFNDLYTSSIHNHPTLKGSQKLQYLKSALSGEAAALLDSFQISDANYAEAWDTLRKRYQNLRELVKSQISRFLEMPTLKSESGAELRKLVDTSTSVVRALKALKRPIADDCDLAMHIISTRLDVETTKLWETKVGRDRIPTLIELLDFLDERAAILSSSESGKTSYNQLHQKVGGNNKKAAVHQTSTDDTCAICKKGSHPTFSCKEFLELPVSERRNHAKKLSLCFNCLRPGHNCQKCFSKSTCKQCKGKHNTLLHLEQLASVPKEEHTGVSANTAQSSGGTKRALLATVLVNITDAFGQVQIYRALLDPGADVSCVSEKCAQQLGIARKKSDVEFTGLGSSSLGKPRGVIKLSLRSRFDADFIIDVEALILHRVPGDLPKLPCRSDEISAYLKLPLADPSFFTPGAVDLLLGSDVFFESLRPGKLSVGKCLPVATETAWGWIVGGTCPSQGINSASVDHIRCEEYKLDELLTRFWRIEELPSKPILTAEERICETCFIKTTIRDEEGRFVVELPFKTNHLPLGASRDIAVRRLKQMERMIQRKPELKQKYVEFMNEYLSLGHMELVPPEDLLKPDEETCYIPHHAIVNSKFRVVFDASAKTSTGCSLNDVLMIGPKLQDDLFVILVRFRMYVIAFTADIVKMFRQIWIAQKHRDFQRIVWRDSPDQPIQDFRLTTVTYGTSSAPYLSKRCLQMLSETSRMSHPIASVAVGRDYYMDDLMSGEFDIQKATELQKETHNLMQSAKMDLRKWSSCSAEVLQKIEPSMRAMQTPFCIDEDDVIKTLGLYWLPGPDTFWFKVTLFPKRSGTTKRSISSDTARLFDPLGLLGPVTILGKIMLQRLWSLKQDWDEPVPNTIHEEWVKYRDSLLDLESIKIPRCIITLFESAYEIIGFSDASEVAIAAVVYTRSRDSCGNFIVRIVAAKTKVAPLQQKSLPRLELNGAVLLANLMKSVAEAFIIKPQSQHAFTDSTVVLAWLKEHPKHWDTYVANRVSSIQDIIAYEHWHHVPGTLNPADCASRGIQPLELVNHALWWEGPGFLKDPQYEFSKPCTTPQEALLEKRKKAVTINHISSDTSLLLKFSSLAKLQRVTAYCFRFASNCKHPKETRNFTFLSTKEFQQALQTWIHLVQRNAFAEEMHLLSEKKPVSVKSRLRSLNPFLDSAGLLRVGGRLERAKISEGRKHPYILPKNNKLTALIINYEHLINLHGGCQLVLAAIQRRFWIINGRDAVRQEIRKCVRCHRFRAETATQMMSDLPSVRVTPTRAFLKVGVDFAGPMMLRKGKGTVRQKGYITIFICMVTRAMHLEVVTSLSTQAFIAVLKRFVARRGLPTDIYSDCGRTFVGTDKELRKFWKDVAVVGDVGQFLATRQIMWHYNPQASPHFGGLWEAGIRSIKFHLQRTVATEIFNYEDMATVLVQIEACLNSRPLTPLSPDPSDLAALTPGHFLIGDALTAIPEPSNSEEPISHLNKWKRMQRVTQHFWTRWSREYLSRLQQRPKWLGQKKELQVGELVLVKEERVPPLKWKLARIVKGHPGPDGMTRVYTIKTEDGTYKRPLVKLSPLPIETTTGQ